MKSLLVKKQAYLDGKFTKGNAKSYFEVINPSTLESIGTLPDLPLSDCRKTIQHAHQAWLKWRDLPIGERCKALRKLYELTMSHKDEIAKIITLESGKPIKESLLEVDYGASFIEWFAEEGKRSYGETIPSLVAGTSLQTIKQSVGVVAAITPWNFPLAMLTRKLAPALAAGCSIVVRPASQTPFTTLALAKLSAEAGIPAGVFNVLTSKDSKGFGKELATNKLVRKITFTGSTDVGKSLMEMAASNIKKVSLELGGNSPFIVFDDADIKSAVRGAVAAKFRNAGQTCVAVNRFYVQDAVYDTFSNELISAIKHLKVGDGLDNRTDVGPLINQDGVKKVRVHIEDAINKGATVALGGKSMKGNFFEPTILTNVAHNSLIAQEETFGPVCALFRFKKEEEVIRLANDTDFGLAAYFYSDNIHRCHRVASAIESGMVGINTGMVSNASAPFGGVKQSGLGREGSKYGLEEYMEIKYLCFGELEQ